MRKLELLKRYSSPNNYAKLLHVGYSNSFLITKVPLLHPVKHHAMDLGATTLSHGLNDGIEQARHE